MAIAVFMSSPFLRLYGLTQEEEQHPCRVASRPCQTPNGGRGGRFRSGNAQNSRWGRVGAVRRGIVVCCVGATVGLWSLVGGSLAAAQEPAAVVAAEVGQPPSPDVSMKAYRAVEDWVRGWKVGEEAVPECVAASVTLRMDGEVMGRGVAMGETCLAMATKQAMGESEPKLGAPRDALYQETLKDLAKRMTVSVQLAGELVPITIKDAVDAAAAVAPGLEGVGARLGDRVMVMFPERMLTMGTEPGPALATLVAKLGDDASLAVLPLSMLVKEHGAVYYRFKVSHLAQVKAGDTPRFLSRCGRVVGAGTIDIAELKRWADEMARSLVARRESSQSKSLFVDSFDPVRGGSDGKRAEAFAQLICAEALGDCGSFLSAETTAAALRVCRETYEQLLTDVDWKQAVLADPAAAALMWDKASYAIMSDDPIPAELLDQTFMASCWSFVDSGFDVERGFREKMSPAARALNCKARLIAPIMDKRDDRKNRAAIQRAYLDAGTGGLTAYMPWLGTADELLTAIDAWAKLPPDNRPRLADVARKRESPIAAAVALREMREQLWKHQLLAEDWPPDQQDLAGGIVFATTRSPMPSWQMARPLVFVARMLADPRLTEEKEVSGELLHLLDSLRFLRQLTVRESECFMYRTPERAIGGVRSSLWDQRMPPEATAMTLMAVCETLRSLEEIQKRERK